MTILRAARAFMHPPIPQEDKPSLHYSNMSLSLSKLVSHRPILRSALKICRSQCLFASEDIP
jgi:hypothetical protein